MSASGSQATTEPAFRLEPYAYAEVASLVRELGLAEPVAVTLVRRGYRTVEPARAFLEAADCHDPCDFAGIDEATAVITGAVERGERITVFGDYDVAGVT